jgi:hypothetical protein
LFVIRGNSTGKAIIPYDADQDIVVGKTEGREIWKRFGLEPNMEEADAAAVLEKKQIQNDTKHKSKNQMQSEVLEQATNFDPVKNSDLVKKSDQVTNNSTNSDQLIQVANEKNDKNEKVNDDKVNDHKVNNNDKSLIREFNVPEHPKVPGSGGKGAVFLRKGHWDLDKLFDK